MPEETLFSKIISGDIPGDIVYQDDLVTAFRDINPQAPVHILIVTNKPIPTVDDVTEVDEAALGRLFSAAKKIAAQEGLDQGYRLLVNCKEHGHQEVMHLHMHLFEVNHSDVWWKRCSLHPYDVDSYLEGIETYKMKRNTPQRQAILDALVQAQGPLTVQEIFEQASQHKVKPGLATVYRTINSLEASGEIIAVDLPNDSRRYEPAGRGHHHHFYCQACKAVFELDAKCPVAILEGVTLPGGFMVKDHALTLYGLCPTCQAA